MVNKYTMPIPKYEDEAKTIINRLGQKSISLPRIDDTKRLRGYPGLAGTAEIIAKCVSDKSIYVEPFAGTAKVYQELLKLGKTPTAILNDMSEFTYRWLQKEFNCHVTHEDFIQCFNNYDSTDTCFLFDQPWHKEIYLHGFSCFDRDSTSDYDNQVLDLCRKARGDFIICTDRSNPRMLKCEFRNYLAIGKYMVAGGNTKTLLTSNLDLNGIKGIEKYD